jgi:D-alanine-D-alanine ligase
MADKRLKVAVLMGGSSAERDVSLNTGRQVLNALDPAKYDVYALDTMTGLKSLPDAREGEPSIHLLPIGDGGELVTSLTQLPQLEKSQRPDVVFIALHGPGGEDGTVQGFLEMLRIPYTGSGVLASALAMDKVRCKALLSTESITLAPDIIYEKHESSRLRRSGEEVSRKLGFPVIVKPSRQGSTYGCTVVESEEQVRPALEAAFRYDDTVLVEQRLSGTEITVAVIGNREPVALPIVEIVPPTGFFDYESKYSQDEAKAAQEIIPARITEEAAREATEVALSCHRLLGCRGMSRTDMFVTDDGSIVTLEVNTIPGMTATSLLPKAAKAAGIEFSVLMDRLIEYALEK